MTSRILMVLDSMGTGGTETYVLSISKPFLARGARLFYAGADGPFHQEFVKAGFQIQLVESNEIPLHERKDFLKRAYRQIMEQQNITIVHVHMTPSGIIAASAAKELGIPVVFTMHGTYYPREEAIELAQLCDAIISVSKPVERYWRAFGIASAVISNGVNLEEFHPQKSEVKQTTDLPDIPDHATVVTYVSRLAWQKASVCNMVLRSTKTMLEMNDLHIVVVGTGALAFHVHELARNLNKMKKETYIHVVGEQTDVKPYYQRSDLVIGTGRVALEAMACGKPLLAIGNHGFVGLITPEHYVKAWDCYFGDHDSIEKPSPALIAEALRQALRDRGALRTIGIRGREWISSHFDIVQKGQEILDLYERVKRRKEGGEDQ
ncbi:MAG: glycosyltransferase [Brevibacillus sp.]|nr:glycosyltransferase [Brevibacillus sp.]